MIYLLKTFLCINQRWADNRVYRRIRKVDNWYFKIQGPDFNRIMVKCNNPVHGTDNPHQMKVIRQVSHLGQIIHDLGVYPADYPVGYQIIRRVIQGKGLSTNTRRVIWWIIFKKCIVMNYILDGVWGYACWCAVLRIIWPKISGFAWISHLDYPDWIVRVRYCTIRDRLIIE